MNRHLTEEQKLIVTHNGNLVISAGAGTGKSTTLEEYAKVRPDKKILSLAFNKAIADELAARFKRAKLNHVVCKTTHSLAFSAMKINREYKLGYNPNAYYLGKDHFNLDMRNRVNYKTIQHAINKFNNFCDSDCDDINNLDYLSQLVTDESKHFYIMMRKKIDKYAKDTWKAMCDKKLDVSHNWYLKAYQLTKPKLNYDIVMIDEGQDLSPVQMDIFLNQDADKIIVGDSAQSIYGWRGAIDALEKVDFPRLYLTNSFRFSQDIALMCVEVLKTKSLVKPDYDVSQIKLTGLAPFHNSVKPEPGDQIAVLSRSNSRLLIEIIDTYKLYDSIYIEGGFDALLTTQSSIHVFDIVNLMLDERDKINSMFVKTFKDLAEFEEYSKDMDDRPILDFIKLAKRYKKALFFLSKDIAAITVDDKNDAQRIFSSVHKAKGQEYDHVQFITDYDAFPPPVMYSNREGKEYTKAEIEAQRKQILEEVNVCYVALSRARKTISHNILEISTQGQIRDLQLRIPKRRERQAV